jgi:histidinol dehydrogenase
MNVLRYTDESFSDQVQQLTTNSSLFDPKIEESTRAILKAVQTRGDEALAELTHRFDKASLHRDQFALSHGELLEAAAQADETIRSAVKNARRNIERFSRRALRRNWSIRNAQGASVGEKFDPFQRVGIYVPGGTAPLISTALMTVTLAFVAGCREIVVCSPCRPDRSIHPALLYAVSAAGATEVYRLGGAQAIAAMAFGTPTVASVQKIFGPGNAYVVAAKRLLFGRVSVDLLPGPSEVLVLADEHARADWVTADLLAQAEHGSGHERVWLVTPSSKLVGAVQRELERQLPKRLRRDHIEAALANHGWLIQVRDMDQALNLVNRIAPEHCEVMTRRAATVSEQIRTAGAIFVGPWSPTVLGDYLAGPSHTLPTGGAAASFAGLTVDQFQRRTSVVRYDRTSLKRSLATVGEFARLEGLEAHGASAEIRLPRPAGRRS